MTSTPGPKVNARQQNANLLLLNNLLFCQPGTSPFTLVLDSINQPAKDLISRYIYHAAVRIAHHSYVFLRRFKLYVGT